jgi:hypothetical protein
MYDQAGHGFLSFTNAGHLLCRYVLTFVSHRKPHFNHYFIVNEIINLNCKPSYVALRKPENFSLVASEQNHFLQKKKFTPLLVS